MTSSRTSFVRILIRDRVAFTQFPGVAIFGPPGSGKTTLSHLVRRKGMRGIDLEGLARSQSERVEVFRTIPSEWGVVVGTADLPWREAVAGRWLCVQLHPDRERWSSQRSERDAAEVMAGGRYRDQNAHTVYSSFEESGSYHVVIPWDVRTDADTVASALAALASKNGRSLMS